MNYFFVFQNKTYAEERNGGYLWAPKGSCSHWKLMQTVCKGDIIFHCYHQNIVAISVAQTDCYDCTRPVELDKEMWDREGWKVDTAYHILASPIRPKDYMDTVLSLQPTKYAPFSREGRGNTGYLFSLTPDLANFFFKILQVKNASIVETVLKTLPKQ